jgi:hypothetical protein
MTDPQPAGSLHIVLTLAYSDPSGLSEYLSSLSDPSSPVYHHYLTASEFDADFSPSPSAMNALLGYLRTFAVANLTTTPDRVTVAFDASPSVAGAIFDTSIHGYREDGNAYLAPGSVPELPRSLASSLAQVDGLSTYSTYVVQTLSGSSPPTHRAIPVETAPVNTASGYPAPATYDGIQLEYASDFQVAYDEQSLFQQGGYPTNATVATILWSGNYTGTTGSTSCGTLTSGQGVGPWVPADIYDFYNETLPTGQPHSALTAVPIGGAPGPGCSASYDGTGANFENTLDLEMIGSTAPGSHIYNVYGPAPLISYLDQAFSTILSPPNTLSATVRSGLDNVTVISNSWGGGDGNDTGWFMDLEQAQARGISVLASSGDSDDNVLSSKYAGTTVEFPSSVAYNSFGDTAIGGTTVALNPTTLQLESQVVWNISAQDVGDQGPAGSTGGISSVFPEPSWQLHTQANSVIHGAGRGVPDLAGLANNTLVTFTVDGYQYHATNASGVGYFEYAWGTSIASPLTAGMVAEIDHVLRSENNPVLGFLNPTVYSIAKLEYAPLPSNGTGIGAEATGPYLYSLPTTPFYDITSGSNYLYPALPGYDLVTGWGSLDAYNFTMYVLQNSSSGVYGRLSGVQDKVDLTGLSVTSAGVSYNASTQQNFFLANSLGAPIYWVQNVVYISGRPGAWSMWFTGWVIFPFWATYPNDAVYEYNLPVSTLPETTPLRFNFTTVLQNPGSLSADVSFSFGVTGASPLTLPVPGASFLIGSLDYNFSWQGVTYRNGGSAYAPGAGFLSPQFGLVGGPSAGLGDFASPTAGSVAAWVEPWGTSTWLSALTETYTSSITQTGESAENLGFTQSTSNNWSFQYQSGSGTQGVLAYENPSRSTYLAQFNQTGVPTGTHWYVNITSGPKLTGLGSATDLTTSLLNGTYSWTASLGAANWSARPSSGTFTVNGRAVFVDLAFAPLPTYRVQFNQTGVPSATEWYVNVSGVVHLSTTGATSSVSTQLVNATYWWRSAVAVVNWSSTPASGSVTVHGKTVYVDLVFAPKPKYLLEFTETGVPSGATWYVNLTGYNHLSAPGSVTSVSVDFVNGSYPWNASVGIANWSATPDAGVAQVAGQGVTVYLTFALIPTYLVQFNETGVASGKDWFVNITGGPDLHGTSATADLSTYLRTGSYPWTAAPGEANWSSSPAHGTVVVGSSTVWVDLAFAPLSVSVSFTGTGLPSAIGWWLNITGGLHLLETGAGSATNLTYGTYAYRIASTNASYAPNVYAGSFTVPTTRVVSVAFALVTYALTVTATYSGSGNVPAWSANIGGHVVVGPAPSSETPLSNGTYAFTVSVGSGYSVNPSVGHVIVNGQPQTLSVTISPNATGSSGAPFFGLGSTLGWALVGLAVVVVAVAAAALVARRRRRSTGGTPPPAH